VESGFSSVANIIFYSRHSVGVAQISFCRNFIAILGFASARQQEPLSAPLKVTIVASDDWLASGVGELGNLNYRFAKK
jgi:hypothetical protein